MSFVSCNLRRMTTASRVLEKSKLFYHNPSLFRRWKSDNMVVTIDQVSKQLKAPRVPEYVPQKYYDEVVSGGNMQNHLKWMLQKDILAQDMFLMGVPGCKRRHLALAYLELTDREVEFITLSRDTTEADLKQRREIKNSTAYYHDQSAVRAAINGRVLIIENVEKAEQNVLPVLNNLLENREMHLEDGRCLIPASHYDELLMTHGQEELDAWKLVRVSEDFRVIALGLPSPPYPGQALDPTLRSRFQARFIHLPNYEMQFQSLAKLVKDDTNGKLERLLSSVYTLDTVEVGGTRLPDFPIDNLPLAARIWGKCPYLSAFNIFYRFYPYRLFLGESGQKIIDDIIGTFSDLVTASDAGKLLKYITENKRVNGIYNVTVKNANCTTRLNVPYGTAMVGKEEQSEFVETAYQNTLLAEMLESHLVSDFCLIGPKGCGKSITVQALANLLHYEVEPVVLYQDMTSRDLIQQRTTLSNGDTVWKDSPLVEAALGGKLAILDGIDRIHPSTLAILHRLVHDRELQLHDGKRLISSDRYDEIKNKFNKSDKGMQDLGILRIHQSFRIVAMAESHSIKNSPRQWLNSELLSLFIFHEMRPLERSVERQIIKSKYGEPSSTLQSILKLAHVLRSSDDQTLQSLSGYLSTRQLLRIAKRMHSYEYDDAYDAVQRACLARFLPAVAKQALEDSCRRIGIVPNRMSMDKTINCDVTEEWLQIGQTVVERYETAALTKVPNVLFYNVPEHIALQERLLQDFNIGEHLLLVGNQGVGKNKIVDKLLQLMNRPREYIQLHRDTTVQTLTLQTTVKDGKVVYEDSPLVQAVKLGHVLVIDEADKAPTHVTCILKTLVESGEMILSDGRRISPSTNSIPSKSNVIPLHPEFRMIVLANRPGFPFLGNDFFGALGDLFSTHAVDNPSFTSEIDLLKQYGPNVDQDVIHKLVKVFGELRDMSDQGLVSYPYSTREVVNIVKHLEKFPEDKIIKAVMNVFAFDRYNSEVFDTLMSVLSKHGIPIGSNRIALSLAKEMTLPDKCSISVTWNAVNKQVLPVQQRDIKFQLHNQVEQKTLSLDRFDARSTSFSELKSYWNVPVGEGGMVAAMTIRKGTKENGTNDEIHILATGPLRIFSMQLESDIIKETLIGDVVCLEADDKLEFAMETYDTETVVVYEKTSQMLCMINLTKNNVHLIKLSWMRRNNTKKSNLMVLQDFDQIVLYTNNSNQIEVIDIRKNCASTITLPFNISSLLLLSPEKWLIQDTSRIRSKYILSKNKDSSFSYLNILEELEESDEARSKLGCILGIDNGNLDSNVLSAALQQQIDSPNRLLVTDNTYAGIIVGFPDLDSSTELHFWPKESKYKSLAPPVILNVGQVVRTVLPSAVPFDVVPKNERHSGTIGYLEIADVANHKLRYIPVPGPAKVSGIFEWLFSKNYPLYIASKLNQDLVTVDVTGCVRVWETSLSNIEQSLEAWQRMVASDDAEIQITKERYSGLDVNRPKHGKVDKTNAPHVGGNTWAGGTGGRDTAGLGGKGGPYRLDAGHTVHQLSDEEKNAVPEHVKEAARKMGLKAFRQRLKEIQMSEFDHKVYSQYSDPIQRQVQSLRTIIGSLQSKSNERQWCRHQTSGELDDTKLIEGLTGERTIYRRRAEKKPEVGSSQLKPKRLKLVVDVSGSMYRFNGYDGRLDREMEACVMVMEAFSGYEGKIQYDIIGHSGDEHNICFVHHALPPTNNKCRLEVIKMMQTHSQFCMTGDNTLEATYHAITSLATEDSDASIVVVLSDANLERYGIRPERFANTLVSNPDVSAFAIFIGSLGDQAVRLTKQMPSGRAFVCMDLKDIPRILQQIFSASLLSS